MYPFVSVHIAAYDEPPELVIATLKALSRMRYPAFEVIILDNNTPDPATWRPVEAACRALGPRFRFYHRGGVRGAKAGALEIARALSDPRADLIATVDADYRVTPEFLTVGVAALQAARADFVQFPQAYDDFSRRARGVELELEDYFASQAVPAGAARAMLLTGTLSLISRPALEAIGGWRARTSTEDAETGLQLNCAGFEGVYCPRRVGAGLLPMRMTDLQAQRARWTQGNLRALIEGANALARLPRRRALAVVAQLTAWARFWAIPILALMALAATAALAGPLDASGRAALALASWSVIGTLAITLARLAWTHRRRPAAEILGAALTSWALTPTGSWALLRAFTGGGTFRRTPKTFGARGADLSGAALTLVMALCAIFFAHSGEGAAMIACLLVVGAAPAGMWVDRRLTSCAGAPGADSHFRQEADFHAPAYEYRHPDLPTRGAHRPGG